MSACWRSVEFASSTKSRARGGVSTFRKAFMDTGLMCREDLAPHTLAKLHKHCEELVVQAWRDPLRAVFGSAAIIEHARMMKEVLAKARANNMPLEPSHGAPSRLIAFILPLRGAGTPEEALELVKFIQGCQLDAHIGPVAIADHTVLSWAGIVAAAGPSQPPLPADMDYVAFLAGDFCRHAYFSLLRHGSMMR